MGRKIYRRDSNPGSIRGWPIIPMLHIYMVCLARLCKTHTYPVWGMTTLRQFRSSGPMRAPCSRGLSLGLLVPNVYWVLFFFVPGTLAAPCLTCFGFQPGCTYETTEEEGETWHPRWDQGGLDQARRDRQGVTCVHLHGCDCSPFQGADCDPWTRMLCSLAISHSCLSSTHQARV